jgi:hypothetical protein
MSNDNESTDNVVMVRHVGFVRKTLTSLSEAVEGVGLGVHESPVEAQHKSESLKNSNLHTAVLKKKAGSLTATELPMTKVWSGKATIAELMKAAKEFNGKPMLVKDFVNKVFKGDTDFDRAEYRKVRTHEGRINKSYCLGFALDWDSIGPVDPVDFVNVLSMETMGHPRYIDTSEAIVQVFEAARSIFATPQGNHNGYPPAR